MGMSRFFSLFIYAGMLTIFMGCSNDDHGEFKEPNYLHLITGSYTGDLFITTSWTPSGATGITHRDTIISLTAVGDHTVICSLNEDRRLNVTLEVIEERVISAEFRRTSGTGQSLLVGGYRGSDGRFSLSLSESRYSNDHFVGYKD